MSARQRTPKLSRRGIPARVLEAIDLHQTSRFERLGIIGRYRVFEGAEVFEGTLTTGADRPAKALRLFTRQLLLPLHAGAES